MCDYPEPAVYEHVERTCRKPTICCECRKPIVAGQRYHDHRGIWEGEWSRYPRCVRCERVCAALDREMDYCRAFTHMRRDLGERLYTRHRFSVGARR